MAALPSLSQLAGRHLATYEALYKELDPRERGMIPANEAATFMKRSNLGVAVLGQIWEFADHAKRGTLDKTGVFIALKLMALAQQGQAVSMANLAVEIGPPSIASRAATPSLPAFAHQDWGLDESDRQKYEAIFESLGPMDGKLSGEKVRPVLLNSGLPANVLGKIWELADIDKDGYLDREEMCVGLHLVYRALQNDPVPNALPLSLVPPSKRGRRESTLSSSGSRRTSIPTGGVAVLPGKNNKLLPPPSFGMTGSGQRSRTSSVASMDSVGVFGSPATGFGGPSAVNGQSAGQMYQGPRSLTGTPTMSMPIVPPAPWVVDKMKYESLFTDADTDRDGLVSGGDVKDILLASGVAQNYLAHIWALVDINKTGKLNCEQFALAMHLIELKRDINQDPPPTLSPDLIPPSFRPSPAGMTDTSTSTQDEHTITMPAVSSGNKEIDDLTMEMQSLRSDRRQVDSAIIQLEADMTIKQSEIKNLEIELNTLETTVKQLERQKGEAGRRLNDLDSQREAMAKTVSELRDKVALETADVTRLRTEAQMSMDSARTEEDSLNKKRAELQSLRDEEHRLEVELQNERANVDATNRQFGVLEADIQRADRGGATMVERTNALKQTLARLEQLIAANDADGIMREEATLLAALDGLSLTSPGSPQKQSMAFTAAATTLPQYDAPPASAYYDQVPDASTSDPFASRDPFGASAAADPFASSDPFGGSAGGGGGFDDAFGGKDPFGGGGSQGGEWGGGGSPTKSKPGPPRPAPPKNRPVTPKNGADDPFAQSDPFSNSGGGAATGGFANFANFNAFS
uniref:Epidermal growth factor receptor substrate 15-like 1 n=1 Tax=Plectus sambesii TaxID=2011161 RepID=A0A914WF97_9BILA